jgi:hypothetical protein
LLKATIPDLTDTRNRTPITEGRALLFGADRQPNLLGGNAEISLNLRPQREASGDHCFGQMSDCRGNNFSPLAMHFYPKVCDSPSHVKGIIDFDGPPTLSKSRCNFFAVFSLIARSATGFNDQQPRWLICHSCKEFCFFRFAQMARGAKALKFSDLEPASESFSAIHQLRLCADLRLHLHRAFFDLQQHCRQLPRVRLS